MAAGSALSFTAPFLDSKLASSLPGSLPDLRWKSLLLQLKTRVSGFFSLVAQMVKTACNTEDAASIPGYGRSPGESHGQRSLADYSLWDHKELDMTE